MFVNDLIKRFGVDRLFEEIPDDWQYAETMFGSKPNKRGYVYAYFWELYVEDVDKLIGRQAD